MTVRVGINGRFYRAPVSGVQRFAREVAGGVARRAETVLLLPRGVDDVHVALAPAVPARRGRLRGHAWEQIELPDMARRAGCDVVLHLSGTLPARGGPHVAVLHDILPLTHPHYFGARFAAWYSLLLRRAVPRAAAILTVSDASRSEIARVLRPRRIDVVPQGLAPFDAPASEEAIERTRRAFSLPADFLLAVGLGDRRKNLGFLPAVLDAFRRRFGPPPPVIAVGGGASRVHGTVKPLFDPDLRAVGRVSDAELHALYSGARVLLFPSIAEGFGRPPLEAAACGTPALIAREANLPAPASHAGLHVPLEPTAWADAVAALLSEGATRMRTVNRGRAACAGLSWDRTAERVVEICHEVGIAGRTAARAREGIVR